MPMTEQDKKIRDELAEYYATTDGAIIEKRECFTVDKHLGAPQQYEYVKIYNNNAYCAFRGGFDAGFKNAIKQAQESLFKILNQIDHDFDYDIVKSKILKSIEEYDEQK